MSDDNTDDTGPYVERWNPIGATFDDGDWWVLFSRFNQGEWEFCQVAMAWEHIGRFDNPEEFLRSQDTGTEQEGTENER